MSDPGGAANGTRADLFVARPPILENGAPRIQRLLIANRGEIACRIIATCQTLGIVSIAIFAEEDRDSLHVKAADEAISIGAIDQPKGNPYQNAELLVQTALSAKADAVHPGYGYLSENSEFSKVVREADLLFVGPSPHAISILGNKRQAKDFLQQKASQVPLIPGYSGSTQDVAELENQAAKIGYPVLIKASAGGGGRGLSVVHSREGLQEELSKAQSEAQRSFGSSDCMLEKYIEHGKHIEVQIIADSSGEIISLFDRECSVQRRYQKIIEEAPSPWLPQSLRDDMVEAAKAIGRSMKYENAGTVEFIVDVDSGRFYFLEVNTRIQVEHAITEETTGVDIVALQLFVTAGGLLADCEPLRRVSQFGHAIECRICAEDPAKGFIPDSGLILQWNSGKDGLGPREMDSVRVETAVRTGSIVSTYFDSMIAKIIVRAADRPSAILKMLKVLRNTICIGIKTNILFLQACLLHPGFRRIDYTTKFIPENIEELLQNPFAGNPNATAEDYAFAPALFATWISDRSRQTSAHRPFRSITLGFRNQSLDTSNTAADVVVGDASNPLQTEPLNILLTWRSTRGASGTTFAYQSHSIPTSFNQQSEKEDEENESTPAMSLIRHYNEAFLNVPREAQAGSREHSVRLVEHKIRDEASASQKWLTCDLVVEHDGRTKKMHLVTDTNFHSKGVGMPQRIYCHSSDLGSSVIFYRYTLLAYGESLRAQFGVAEAVDEERIHKSFMPCKILRILIKKGDQVKKGQTMLVVESMKTEMNMVANLDGTFEPNVSEGDAVDAGVALFEIV